MFEYIWYVLNNLDEVPFYYVLPIIVGVLVIIGIITIIKWIIKLF
ncbi:hypothetical protein ES705_44941 [subsurface metagenome]|jgi:hypothetical protein